ncbi:MAG TPA: ABC transporter permease [Bryobacteraceae bacterium]|nr:ABC transporter permease [Bryobacteraceae bacterium]
MEPRLKDVKHALRMFRRSPAFTIAAVATMALGIGATTAVFSVVNTVLLKPLTYPDSDRIVRFLINTPTGLDYGGSPTRYNILRRQTQAFQDISAYTGFAASLTGGANPEQVHALHVTAGYFHLFGAPMIEGRSFTADEDRPNGGNVVVLSFGLWQRRFAGDRSITGKSISLNGAPHTVVGVVGPGFNTEVDAASPDLWLPFQIDPNSVDHGRYFDIAGRLRPGVTLAVANAQLALATKEFRGKFPNLLGPRDEFIARPLRDVMVLDVRPSLLVLAGAVCLVLLIASANVASLLLVRATGRKRELAIRAAIGAGRSRLVRQLLTESLLLSLAGGVLGLALGSSGIRVLLSLNPGNIPRIGPHGALVTMDWRVLLFALAVSLATGLLFGLLPALHASRADLNTALKEGSGRSGTGAHSNKARSLLVTAEIALALILVIGSALLIRTFLALRSVNAGLDPHNVLTLRMSLSGSRFERSSQVSDLVHDGVQRLEALPGVARAAATYVVPLEGMFGVPFNIVGRTPAQGRYDGRGWLSVSPGYFVVFRIPVLRGRGFTDRDNAAGPPVAIINEALARQFWPKGSPLGERLLLGKGYGPEFEEPAREIVGIVGDVRNFGLDTEPPTVVYVPLAQVTDGLTTLASRASRLAWMARTRGNPMQLSSAIQNQLQQASGGLPLASVRSMDEVMSESTASKDFDTLLMSIFGCAALLLAAIGVYGLMAYAVAQRTQEIGIRLALGAEMAQVRNMVILQGMRLAALGIAIGLASSFGLSRLIASFLFGVKPHDPLAFTLAPAVITVVALVAVWLPARRATLVDPVTALRSE